MSLEKLTTRQLKQLSYNLEDCYNIVKFALSQRMFDDDVINSGYSRVNARQDSEFNPSSYFKLQFLHFQIELNYNRRNYYIVFTGFQLKDLQTFFESFRNKSIYNFNNCVFDKLGSYSLYIPRDNANINYFNYAKAIFLEFVGFFQSFLFDPEYYLDLGIGDINNGLCESISDNK